jgi:hypothetical protein
VVRGWAEPHFSSSFGLVPPGVMVVYTPRDEHEAAVCQSLFWVSYNFSLSETSKNFAEWEPWYGVGRRRNIREPIAMAL